MLLVLGETALAQSHILVQEGEYPSLQALADQPGPWAAMKADAIATANSLGYDPGISGFNSKNYRLRDVVDANALAYILDPANRDTYRDNLRDALTTGLQDITVNHSGDGWTHNVPQGSMAFSAVIGLDVIRYELSPGDLATIESLMDTAVNQIYTSAWQPNAQSARALWALYQGDTTDFQNYKAQHDVALAGLSTDDGVFKAGNAYAAQRLSQVVRQAKSSFLDVLEIQGHHEYYTNPQLRGAYEYLYGYSASPFGRTIVFGDTEDYGGLFELSGGKVSTPQVLRAGKFSEKAARYAAWHLRENGSFGSGDVDPKGRPITYVTMDQPVSTQPEVSPSRSFDSYGAFFERRQSTDALYGGLLCLASSDGHSHKEVNAVALGGFGEHILRNAGYNGWGAGVGMASWQWINNTAESGNTVMIDGVDHQAKSGGGIDQGLTGMNVEFARGDSGGALPNGRHQRDLLFVQPAGATGGYWLVSDHVQSNQAGATVDVVWHPNSPVVQVDSPGEKYLSEIGDGPTGEPGPRLYGNNQVKMTTYLGTTPQSVQLKDTTLASRGDSFDAQYLHVTYPNPQSRVDALTVLFPHDQDHQVGAFSRVTVGDYTGATITQGDVVDVALVSDGVAAATFNGADFQGQDVFFRSQSGSVLSYLVVEGTMFEDGAPSRRGFASDDPVSLLVDGNQGQIVSPGTDLTLYVPEIDELFLDGQQPGAAATGDGWITFFTPVGTHDLQWTVIPEPSSLALAALALLGLLAWGWRRR